MSCKKDFSRTRARTCAQQLNILIACEESQAECEAFRRLGHNAYSCDLQQCRPQGHPEWHIIADVRPFLQGKRYFVTQDAQYKRVPRWDLIIAHPPCTYLCKVSSVHIWKDGQLNLERVEKMNEAREFFFECLNAKAPYVAVENPQPMALADLPQPTCYACPSWFGARYTKKTLYWLKNLPPLMAEREYPDAKSFVGSSRGKYRSRTFPQLADAIARQWSAYILNDLRT